MQTWAIAIIPMGMVWTLGAMIQRRRLAVVLFTTMLALYVPMVAMGVASELGGNAAISAMGIDQSSGSMEGKEVRLARACRRCGQSRPR